MIEKIKFVKVELPIINREVQVLAKELKELEGKTISMDLTRDLNGKSVEAIFRIHISGDKALASMERLDIFQFYVRRMMRKSIDYVEDSFDSKSKDNIMRVKQFMITRKKVHRSVLNAIRIKAKEEISAYFQNKSSDEIFLDLLSGKFQKLLAQKIKKIYPLSFCDIRDIFIVRKKAEARPTQ